MIVPYIRSMHKKVLYLGLLLSMVMLTACAEPKPTTFYVLDSNTRSPMEELQATNTKRMPKVLLQEIKIPDYLDRDALVNRPSHGVKVEIASFNSWAEGLEGGIQRVLSDVLMNTLLERRVALLSIDNDSAKAKKLYVFIQRFDGQLGGSATIDARWTLHNHALEAVASGAFVDSMPAGPTYDSMVAAQSKLLVKFAEYISDPIASAARK